MTPNKLIKLLLFNFTIIIINAVVFSRAFLGIEISGDNAFESAFGITAVFVSVALFIMVNWKILVPERRKHTAPLMKDKDIITLDNCLVAIKQYIESNSITFQAKLTEITKQVGRFTKKKNSFAEQLSERFGSSELSYQKFASVVVSIEKILLRNIKAVLNRVNAFDEEEFEEMAKSQNARNIRSTTALARKEIFDECIGFVQKVVEDNEDVILKLDRLLLELSKLSSEDVGQIEDLPAMKEIEQLIQNTKWYK